MSWTMIALLLVAYFFITRIVGSFFLNLLGPSIDDREDGWIHLVMWVPVIGELGFIFITAIISCLVCVEVVNRRTAKLAEAVKRRLKSE